MVKKILISVAILAIAVIGTVYIYRHAIIRYYAEKIIREKLPPYIKVDKINFDFANNNISLSGFKVLNPPGFSSEYILNIGTISCKYRILGKLVPEGIEIKDILFKMPDIEVERLNDGRINVVEMGNFVKKSLPKGSQGVENAGKSAEQVTQRTEKKDDGRKLSDYIKLPGALRIKNGKTAFLDRLPYDKPHIITVDSINADVSIGLEDNYSRISSLAFTLEGNLDDATEQTIKWTASLDPTKPRLTMSNRFEVSDIDLVAFEPYYDKFSPFIFKKGRFSGALVFDFDNGQIGSTNEIRLSSFLFYVKPGYENSQMWETNVQDLLRYFTTPSGEVVFDFKLKGDMASPTFYLGPISKRAITSMAVDKIASYAVDQLGQQKDAAGGKAQQAIDVIRQLIKKK